jgi:hypothetical protein
MVNLRLSKFFCFCLLSVALSAQKSPGPLTNQKVGDLVIAGVSPGEVIRIIGSAAAVSFDLRPNSTDNLLSAGVSEEIIKAMAARESGSPTVIPAQTVNASPIPNPSLSQSGKLRVFVERSNDSWYLGGKQGTTHPQTVEVMKTFRESCPGFTVTDDPTKADYKIQFERESGKLARRHNKFAAFNRAGDMVFADSTRALGNSVRRFCTTVER